MVRIHPLHMDWTNVKQVIDYGQRRYGRGWTVVGPNRKGVYSIIKTLDAKEYCKTYKVKEVCRLL